eukprot:11915-Heterococcus_DN1.PRE.1
MTSANCAKISYPLVAANTEAGAVRVAVAIASPIVLRIYDLKIEEYTGMAVMLARQNTTGKEQCYRACHSRFCGRAPSAGRKVAAAAAEMAATTFSAVALAVVLLLLLPDACCSLASVLLFLLPRGLPRLGLRSSKAMFIEVTPLPRTSSLSGNADTIA